MGAAEGPECIGGKCDAAGDGEFGDEPGVTACAEALEAIPAEAIHSELRLDPRHEQEVVDAVRTCLSVYIQINTSNPRREGEPGETAAARFFAGVFERMDVPFQFTDMSGEPDPDRQSIVATLRGASREDSIVLLSHTDVVRADGEWSHPPFSGHDDGEFVWGRGAIDMKIISILQLVSMSMIKRAGMELDRDVHFVATADEEIGGRGAEFIALTGRDAAGRPIDIDPLGLQPGIVLNEGGTAMRNSFLPERDLFLIGVQEKGLVWTQLAAPSPDQLIEAMVRTSIAGAPDPAILSPAETQAELGEACRTVAMQTDEEQKTNIQPRTTTIELECDRGRAEQVEAALAGLDAGFDPAPRIDVDVQNDGDADHITISIEQGSGGHGFDVSSDTALDVAVAALASTGQVKLDRLMVDEDVQDRFFAFALSDANQRLIETAARIVGPVTSSLVGWLTGLDGFVGAAGEHVSPLLPNEGPFRNTCSWTAFDFPVDGEARTKLDCRLIHQISSEDFEPMLVEAMAEANDVELRNGAEDCFDCTKQEFTSSPFSDDTSDYAILEYVTEMSSPDAVVTPYLFPASGDSFLFRTAGVPSYGFMAAALDDELLGAFHGLDERFPIGEMFGATKIYLETVMRLGDRVAPSPADSGHRLDDHVECFERDEDLIGDDEWERTDEIECSVLVSRSYYCRVSDDAPRFIRARAEENDLRLHRVDLLSEAFEGTDEQPVPDLDSPLVAKPVYRAHDADTTFKHRLFEGQEFELDTGDGPSRQFLVTCELPTLGEVIPGNLDFFNDAVLSFYAD